MPAYIHGNLAVEQRTEKQRPKGKVPAKAVRRSRGLPVQEKSLYLFTVAVCVVVAGLIIWRYAQIYEMNAKIKEIEKNIKTLEAENMILKKKVYDLSSSEHLLNEAERLGFTVPDPAQVKSTAAGTGKASGSASGAASAGGAKKPKDQP
ncbi:septum formation initiator family protein [Paenibacillus sp. P26]|nr:septum formation initiator family protein [Paenibacillus sp. P26]